MKRKKFVWLCLRLSHTYDFCKVVVVFSEVKIRHTSIGRNSLHIPYLMSSFEENVLSYSAE